MVKFGKFSYPVHQYFYQPSPVIFIHYTTKNGCCLSIRYLYRINKRSIEGDWGCQWGSWRRRKLAGGKYAHDGVKMKRKTYHENLMEKCKKLIIINGVKDSIQKPIMIGLTQLPHFSGEVTVALHSNRIEEYNF
jgi:hypothetical protein